MFDEIITRRELEEGEGRGGKKKEWSECGDMAASYAWSNSHTHCDKYTHTYTHTNTHTHTHTHIILLAIA